MNARIDPRSVRRYALVFGIAVAGQIGAYNLIAETRQRNGDKRQKPAVTADTVEQDERNAVVVLFVVHVEMNVRCAE